MTYQLYQPMAQEARRSSEIAVRTAGIAPSTLVDSIRTTMMSLDADLPVRKLQSAESSIARVNYGYGVRRQLALGDGRCSGSVWRRWASTA